MSKDANADFSWGCTSESEMEREPEPRRPASSSHAQPAKKVLKKPTKKAAGGAAAEGFVASSAQALAPAPAPAKPTLKVCATSTTCATVVGAKPNSP